MFFNDRTKIVTSDIFSLVTQRFANSQTFFYRKNRKNFFSRRKIFDADVRRTLATTARDRDSLSPKWALYLMSLVISSNCRQCAHEDQLSAVEIEKVTWN